MSILKKEKMRNCHCNWSDCHEFRCQLSDCCVEDDCWVADPFSVTFSDKSDKLIALQASIALHVPGTAEILNNGMTFYLAHHHWPRSLHDFIKSQSVFPSM